MKFRVLTIMLVGAVALAAAAFDDAVDPPVAATAAKAKHCRQVDVKFEPDGEGSAVGIHVWNVGCRKARRVVRHCIQGKTDTGWTASATTGATKIVLRSGSRKITYSPAGGGGCADI